MARSMQRRAAMLITRVESERLIIRRRVGAEALELPPFGIFSRWTGKELGSASLEPADERGTWSVSVWIEEGSDCAREAIAALTRVALELLEAERVEMIVLAGDEDGRGVLETLGFHRAERALSADGIVMDRWIATATATALRMVPRLRVLRGEGGDASAAAPVWVAGAARTVMADALANYAD